MDALEKLTKHFTRFPGIGPRQARRFVAHLLSASKHDVTELADMIRTIQESAIRCARCGRHFIPKHGGAVRCRVCADDNRGTDQLMVVEKDIDVDHIDRSGAYRGGFFVLGGTIPLLAEKPEETVRLRELATCVEDRKKEGLKEIILALSTNVEGEETATHIKNMLGDASKKYSLTITHLGRGLSSGAEIEYADMETLKNAVKHRVV